MIATTSERNRRVSAIKDTLTRHKAIRDNIASTLHARREEVDALGVRAEKLAKVGELLRLLVDKLVSEQRKVVEGLVTEGLQSVFHDQGLAFEADLVQRAGRVEIDITLRRGGTDDMPIKGHPLEAFGGGPTSVTSLLLRVIALRRLNRAQFLFLDESLAAVSDEYVDATGKLLQKVCSSMGLDVLLVTHKASFLDHADLAYQAFEETIGGAPVALPPGGTALPRPESTRMGLKRLRTKPS